MYVYTYLLIIFIGDTENTRGSSMYVKSASDSVILLSIKNLTGPLPRPALTPATHCTNVPFNVLKTKEMYIYACM